ncbi:MAG: ABC transporter ATP-binding protein [Lachnospiraceae bacterium]|nr:ABC transporter ATP-binding protein [Butyrivibrio sp.]MCM1344577.1 ABC transporter ATP-binding protein [Muribaculaceae bacterium]MCM1411153.1 ABC transporter ATP-binding protein [Lachnospiraceae bacterium]
MEKTIEIEHVSKVIRNEKQKNVILNDISFFLDAGTVTAIVGKSGCGKSTFLAIASGIDAPTGGTVRLLGKDFYKMDTSGQEHFRNENIGVLFQNYHLIPELTCEENIRMPLCFSNGGSTNEKKLDQWIRGVGLDQKRRLFPSQMSGGEQQRTALLRAIVNDPQILFADEPTGALDSKTGDGIIKFLIGYAHSARKTILLVTHDMDIAAQCDRVIEMADGRIG